MNFFQKYYLFLTSLLLSRDQYNCLFYHKYPLKYVFFQFYIFFYNYL